jgi:hypothetical protein
MVQLSTLVRDIHRLNHQLERFEQRYSMLSTTFYEAYSAGMEPGDDAWVLDFEKWAGLYEVWRDRQRVYEETIQHIRRQQPSLFKVVRPVMA